MSPLRRFKFYNAEGEHVFSFTSLTEGVAIQFLNQKCFTNFKDLKALKEAGWRLEVQ